MTTPNGTQPTPYSLQASCELSEDYFLTQNLLIEPGDEVIPFVYPFTQMVEAIVFTQANGGSVYHLQRDPSAMGGWLPATINLTGNVSAPTSVAVAANNTAVYMMVYGQPDNLGDRADRLHRAAALNLRRVRAAEMAEPQRYGGAVDW